VCPYSFTSPFPGLLSGGRASGAVRWGRLSSLPAQVENLRHHEQSPSSQPCSCALVLPDLSDLLLMGSLIRPRIGQVLRARGARVLAVGRTDRRLDLARQLGAEAIHSLAVGPGRDAATAFSGQEGADVVIETAGTPEAVAEAIELVRPGGRVVLTGLPHEPSRVHFFWVVRRELTLIGSMIYRDEFPEAMRLLKDGAVRAEPLLTHRFPLDAIQNAFTAHRQPDSIKVAVIP